MESAPVVALRHWSKHFGGARALDDVSLEIASGEVHGLLGQNGSGKSTLIKVLAGFHVPEPGAELEVNGQPVAMPLPPNRFRELGIAFVHQDLGLVNDLTVLENLRIGMLSASRSLRIPWARERRAARATFERFGVEFLDPEARVADLTETERALLAIVRAVEEMRAHLTEGLRGLLVLDEPTVFLPAEGVEQLFAMVGEIVAQHASVLFVSHDITEAARITDRITVLRDGRVAGTVRTSETSRTQLIELIVGHPLDRGASATATAAPEGVRARVRGLTGVRLREVDFDVRGGEILGVTGLVGSGFEDIPYLLFGAEPAAAGKLELDGTHDLTSLQPSRACAAGLALLPADRQVDGSVGDLPVADNLMLQVLDAFRGPLGLRDRRIEAEAARQLEIFDVRPRDTRLPYEALSGGNQQRVLFAKWLQPEPVLLLLHEPTQGVDVGAREQIFALLSDVARKGTAVLVASSDHEQLATVCDRVLVFGRGRVVAELRGAAVTKERIAHETLESASLAATTGAA